MATARRRPAALAALGAALVLAALPLLGRGALVEATSWIDAPLDGAVLPLSLHEVVAHSADQDGIAEVVFEVDGQQVDGWVTGGDARLQTSRFRWSPTGFGPYLLTVRARNGAGEWGAPASVTVVISEAAPSAAPTVEPGASAGASPGASSTPGPTLGPGQTPGPTPPPGSTPRPTLPPGSTPAPTPTPGSTPRPTLPPGSTPAPTPTPTEVPTPQPCVVPLAIPVYPIDFIKLYPPETNPLFEWLYTGDEDCIASQTLFIQVPPSVGEDEEIPLGAGARSYQRRTAFLPDLTDIEQCGHYHWYVLTVDADGTGEQSAPGSFDICASP